MDPSQQQQTMNQMAALGTSLIAFGLFFSIAVTVFFVWMFWRIFTKAGLSGPLALLNLVPLVGPIIVLCILAFSRWNVVPVAPGYAGVEPPYPPTSFARAEPPAQL